MRYNSAGNIDGEVVGRIACASLCHEDEVPRAIVSRSRACGMRQGNKTNRGPRGLHGFLFRDPKRIFAGTGPLGLRSLPRRSERSRYHSIPTWCHSRSRSSTPSESVAFLFWGAGVFVLPITIIYTLVVDFVFKGKVDPDAEYHFRRRSSQPIDQQIGAD